MERSPARSLALTEPCNRCLPVQVTSAPWSFPMYRMRARGRKARAGLSLSQTGHGLTDPSRLRRLAMISGPWGRFDRRAVDRDSRIRGGDDDSPRAETDYSLCADVEWSRRSV